MKQNSLRAAGDLQTSQSLAGDEPAVPLVELFSAIQGEGLNVGTRQIFIRFGGCDLRCHFCDSAHTWYASQTCQIERSPGQRNFATYPNPVSLSLLLQGVEQQNQPGLHDSISLTGGEPLLHADFLEIFLPLVRQRTGLPIYLETAGHLPMALQQVLPHLDTLGMDIKLPSVSGENHWQAHAEFLGHCAAAAKEVFCKLIVSRETNPADLQQATELIAAINQEIPVFLQPVTPLTLGSRLLPPTPEQVLAWQGMMKTRLKSVRVIPQTHKVIGQR